MKEEQKQRIKDLFADRKYFRDLVEAGTILKKRSLEGQNQQKEFLKELASLEILLSIELLEYHKDNPNFEVSKIQNWEDFQKLMKKLEE